MLIVMTPLLVALVGLLMYALAANPKLQEIGRILFFVGMFWLVGSFGAWAGASGRGIHVG